MMAKTKIQSLQTIIFIAIFAVTSAQKLSKYFRVCSRSDPDLGSCIMDSINGARKYIIQGVPELGLGPVDPLFAREIRLEEGQQDINLRIILRNVTWTGISTFTVTKARLNFDERYLELETELTDMSLVGLYTFRGSILTFRITGDGDFNGDFAGLNCTHSVDFEEVTNGGVLHWKVKKWNWGIQAKSLKVNFRNLFQGNQRLGRFANQFLNTNWRAAWQVYGYLPEREFGNLFKDHVNSFFEKIPLDNMIVQ